MHVKDNVGITNYVTALTTGGQTAHIVYDLAVSDHDRFVLIQTLPDGHFFGAYIADSPNTNDNLFKGQLSLDTTP